MHRFKEAIENIKNDNLRNLVKTALTAVANENPYFFYAPASVSGRYHPEDECARGGLVKHTLRTVAWGRHIARAWALDPNQEDAVAAALILHDTGKGTPDAGPYDQHPDRAADNFLAAVFPTLEGPQAAVSSAARRYSRAEILMITEIEAAIRHHMGPWTREEIRKPVACYGEVERAVYTADYCASRRELADGLKAA
jgi:CRISPR/Cas system-associated endonuclease Cas3-HD